MSSFKDTLRFRNGSKHSSSPIGQLIETATDTSSQGSENWGLFLTICDAINAAEDGPKDAVKAIRKRFSCKIPATTVLTLKLLETCVKNCGKRFHIYIATKEFMQELIKIISPKHNPSVELQNQVLGLIQTWSYAFQSSPELKEVTKHYQELKAKGVEFPTLDPELASQAFIPEKSAVPVAVTELPIPRGGRTIASPLSPTGQSAPQSVGYPVAGYGPAGGYMPAAGYQAAPVDRVAKLKSELSTVQQNCRVFGELLTEMTTGTENTSDVELLEDLNTTCRQMQKRIVELIETVQNEQITDELLGVNDELNNVFLRYDRYCRLRAGRQPTGVITSSLPVEPPVYESIDSNASPTHQYFPPVQYSAGYQPTPVSSGGAGYQPTSVSSSRTEYQPAAVSQPTRPAQTSDVAVAKLIDFDTDTEVTSTTAQPSVYPSAALAGLSLGGDTGTTWPPQTQPTRPIVDRESDIEEMEKWLHTNPGGGDSSETATSSEFDNFLSQRAREADRLPETTGAGATGGQRSLAGSSGAELFSL